MSAIRSQGRPRRGATEVGREKIVQKLQQAVRSGADFDLSRKTLSEYAGVTPALISYYFPKKEMLLEEVAGPIISQYRMELEKILEMTIGQDAKLKKVVILLVSLYTKDGRTLDMYADVIKKGNSIEVGEIAKMTDLLGDFFSARDNCSVASRFDATVLQGAMWGMCRFAAQVEFETADLTPLVTTVLNLVSMGLSDKSMGLSNTRQIEMV